MHTQQTTTGNILYTPYLWLPSFNGNFKYSLPPSTGSPEVQTYYLNKLNAVLMLAGDARKGNWSLFSDLIYLDISGSDSHVKSVDFGGSQISSSYRRRYPDHDQGHGLYRWRRLYRRAVD